MKRIAFAIVCALLVTLFAACGSSGNSSGGSSGGGAGGGAKSAAYTDGVYMAVSSPDDTEAYGVVTITIEGGEIADCRYVTYQKDGTIKAEDYGKVNGEIESQDFYEKAQLAVAAMQQYAEELTAKKNPKEVDAVSGATIAYDQFQESVAKALAEASGK
jgi:major membrane immunogen (membrane-anchored lipoprotein)